MQVFTDRTWGTKKASEEKKNQTTYLLICYWFKPLGSFQHFLIMENTVRKGQKETVVQTSTELNF